MNVRNDLTLLQALYRQHRRCKSTAPNSCFDHCGATLITVFTVIHLKTNSQQLSETCEATDKSVFSELSYMFHFVYAYLTILGAALDNAGTYIPGKS